MLKVKMFPHLSTLHNGESGIKRVVENYFKHLPKYGIKLVPQDEENFDLYAIHAGTTKALNGRPVVAHVHGLYWSNYAIGKEYHKANKDVITSIRKANKVTVPSNWVAETFRRDMRFNPYVLPNGINFSEWKHNKKPKNKILGYAKNRKGVDVCNPDYLDDIVPRFPNIDFHATFKNHEFDNLHDLGLLSAQNMKEEIQDSLLYLSCVKETNGITTMECLASGVPVVGWRYGGNLDLIEHGANGYLAQPGNFDELEYGIKWALKNRDILSKNAIETAKKFDWENIIYQVARLYKETYEDYKDKSVSVVIPCHGKTNYQTRRAIESAANQTKKPDEIIVVYDNQPGYIFEDLDIIQIHVKHGNVADARNSGIEKSKSKYIVCLDADDWIDERFLQYCIDRIHIDNELGIVYTGLMTEYSEKSELSKWPGEFNAELQLGKKRLNQIPTCNVLRKEAWLRAGGFKRRYCPNGAGGEDAALWTMINEIGYNAKQLTKVGLFHYSAFSGNVSGNSNYRELDWHEWFSFSHDDNHKFASVYPPKNGFSHLVNQYDEPLLSIIIPVGDGHFQYLHNAIDSIDAQTFKNWELIIVDDTKHEFDNDSIILHKLLLSYPFLKIFSTDGEQGASNARNIGVNVAKGDLILFLDADDWINTNYKTALQEMIDLHIKTDAAIYSGYIGVAKTSKEYADKMKNEGKLVSFDESDFTTWVKTTPIEYSCIRAIKEPTQDPDKFYIWNLISTLFPKKWFFEFDGFDEKMKTWEDWDLWIRIAKAGKCFKKIDKPFLIYNYETGTLREHAKKNWQSVLKYMTDKHKEIEIMKCTSCSKKTQPTITLSKAVSTFNDAEFVEAQYISPKIGNFSLIVPAMGAAPKINYGYGRRRNDVFLVHKDHAKLNPHLFVEIKNEFKPELEQIEELPEPDLFQLEEEITESGPASDLGIDGEQDQVIKEKLEKAQKEEEQKKILETENLYSLINVSDGIKQKMLKAGLFTRKDILSYNLQSIKGIGQTREIDIKRLLR